MTRLAAALALALAGACAGCVDPAHVLVHVAGPTLASPNEIVQLHVTVTLDARTDEFLAPDPTTAALVFPLDFTITLPRGDGGTLGLMIEGLGAGGGAVAAGSYEITVAPGDVVETDDLLLTAL